MDHCVRRVALDEAANGIGVGKVKLRRIHAEARDAPLLQQADDVVAGQPGGTGDQNLHACASLRFSF